ncbi:hypothetical protein AQJ84_11255 [Streptomyces resistomycificus]|uniref:Uncharacterized protein n=1 Tax=Streptomyces resistomycificus TaxID=67356 RepID=A0A0L8L583_9ACTN|nr:hypothetical protein ADK37_23320 [Streptomyces resistomycificus]KUN99517.1 hypothetical protein AQJ84_11255 [Streptomyces resistomycificus]
MIGEAVDTVVTVGWALAAWIAALAFVAAVVLHSVVAAVWWAGRVLWRGVTAALAATGPRTALSAPLTTEQPDAVPEPPAPAERRTAPHRPAWARKEAA